MSRTRIRFDRHVTPKGLKILNFYDPDSKRAGIEFKTKASTSNNPKGKEGIAHFTEHMLLKASRDYPTEIELNKAFEEIGAYHNATTYPYSTVVYTKGGSVDFERIAYLLKQSVGEFKLTKNFVNSERKVIEKEIIRKFADESGESYELMNSLMFKGSPMQFGNLGTREKLSKIGMADIQSFVGNNYLANNSVISVWGGVESKKVFKTIEKHFNYLNNDPKWEVPKFKFTRDKHLVISKRDSDQVSFDICFRLPNDITQLYKTSLLKRILSYGFTSRFGNRLRVKESLVYGWNSDSVNGFDTARLQFSFSTAKDKFPRIIKAISEEISLLREKGVDKLELEHKKSQLLKPFEWNMETAGDYASWYIDQELFWPEDIETPVEYMGRIKAVTARQIINHARKYLTSDNWFMTVVGDVKSKPILKI